MKLKVITGIVLTLFLIGMLALAFNIQPVKASGTIYIRADGSVYPPTANITSADNVTYTFTGNINDSVVVQRDNIVVDGAGYVVQGAGSGRGIDLSIRSNVTIKNMEIKVFDYGVWLNGSSGNILSENNITANNVCGIWLEYSSNNSISRNNLANSWYGINFYESSNNSIYGNDLANNKYGIVLSDSLSNSISGNNITANDWVGIGLYWSSNNTIRNCNFTDDGISIWGSLDECVQTIEDNVVNGKPLYYFLNQRGMVLDGMDVGQLILVNSTESVIRNLNIFHTDVGIQLLHSSNNIIHVNNIVNNRRGILLWDSSKNVISNNTVFKNSNAIVLSGSSSYNTIVNNNASHNNGDSIVTHSSSQNNEITGNIANSNFIGICIGSNNNTVYNNKAGNNIAYGIYNVYANNTKILNNDFSENGESGIDLWSSSYVTIMDNIINSNSLWGIKLRASSTTNILIDNKILKNRYGIGFGNSSNNFIYHNDFISNIQQVYDESWYYPWSSPSINIWDDGVEGNYWDNYNGTDSNQDGIGDTPYVIDENNTDNCPLMGMLSSFPISSIAGYDLEKTFHVTTISNSTIVSFELSPIWKIGNEYGLVGGAIFLHVAGPEGTKGFFRFAIPKDLLDCPEGLEYWDVYLNGTDVTLICNIWENSTHTFIYVPYNHSTQEIMVKGTWIVPEFPTWTSILLILIVLTVATAIYKRRLPQNRKTA